MIEKVVWLFGRAMSLLKQWAMSRISLLYMTHLATYNIINTSFLTISDFTSIEEK